MSALVGYRSRDPDSDIPAPWPVARLHSRKTIRSSSSTLRTPQTVLTTALVPIGLAYPVANRRSEALKLASQLPGRAARADQLDHLAPLRRRVRGMSLCHLNTSCAQSEGVHKNGANPVNVLLMAQVLGLGISFFPYQMPPLITAQGFGAYTNKQALRVMLPFGIISILIVIPLTILYWKLIGFIP